jgi:hypothetical protein
MRLPAYGKALLRLREAGKVPWVVVVALGHIIDAQTLKGQDGVARIGLPFDFPLDTGDLAILRGLDVLVSLFQPETVSRRDARVLHNRAIAAIFERGQPGLLWCVSEPGKTASPLYPISAGLAEFVSSPVNVPLDRDFRAAFAFWHRCALLSGEGIYARTEFNRARERARHDLLHGHAAA